MALFRLSRRPRHTAARPPVRGERGQSLVLIAAGMIGLLAFVGLTVDAGILFIGMGHLRRAVDAAAIAAASQFREGRSFAELEAAARQVISLNGVNPNELQLRACVDVAGSASPYHDQTLCGPVGGLQRKLIRVMATTEVRFSFLSLVGWVSTDIQSQATSEAASVDVVLVLDTSDSMTQDGVGAMQDPDVCNAADPTGVDGFPGECHPFEEVKSAAVNFVNRLYYPYDRVSVVTFDIVPDVLVEITTTKTLTDVAQEIRLLEVSDRRVPGSPPECTYAVDGDPGGCTNTSIGGGLLSAGDEFGRHPVRQESVWVVILLTDGAANASVYDPVTDDINLFCPDTTWAQPFCRDADSSTRHYRTPGNKLNPQWVGNNNFALYDADDYAKDMADFVACAPKLSEAQGYCTDSLNYPSEGGQGAVIYSIGLGRLVVDFSFGDPLAGDKTLRYIAAVGDDGDATTDLCTGVAFPTLTPGNDSYNCGNYYFSEFGTGLNAVFDSIASRLFTRLTQ